MNTMNASPNRRFYRDSDRAMLGGVCAGIAAYLGFNLRTTRFLAVVAFLMAMPIALAAYIAAVFLIPSSSSGAENTATGRESRKSRKRRCKRAARAADLPNHADLVRRRCREIDARLAKLEKRVTSRRFQLEQEFQRL